MTFATVTLAIIVTVGCAAALFIICACVAGGQAEQSLDEAYRELQKERADARATLDNLAA